MIANLSIWIVYFISLASIVPQIHLNYKTKSAKGLSNFYLISLFLGYIAYLLYVYCLDLPIAYKIMVPISCLLISILIIQQFFWFKKKIISNSTQLYSTKQLYSTNFFIIFLLVILTIKFPYKIGHIAGWFSVTMWSIYQFPQVYKIYSNKSVAGLSLLFISLNCLSNFLGLIAALYFKLPIQSILISGQGIIFFIIFCYQFWLYGKRKVCCSSS